MHVRPVNQRLPLVFYPGMGFELSSGLAHAYPEVRLDALALEQPAQGKRCGQAVGAVNAMAGGGRHQMGSLARPLGSLNWSKPPIWNCSALPKYTLNPTETQQLQSQPDQQKQANRT